MEETTGSPWWDKFFRDLRQGAANARASGKVVLAAKPKPRVADLLHARLEELSGMKLSRPKRIYAGHHQRSQGAWSWYCDVVGGGQQIGSQYPMKTVLLAKDIDELMDW